MSESVALTEAELAYLAGFIDGEGSITIIRTPDYPGRGPRYQVRLQVGNTNEEVMRWLKSRFGGSMSVRPGGRAETKEGRIRNRTLYHWCLCTKGAVTVLRLALPYLRVKKPQAELAIAFQERFMPAGCKGRPPRLAAEKLAAMEVEKQRLQAMNLGAI